MSTASREELVLGTLITQFPRPTPEPFRRLLRFAPDSFDDSRNGAMACAIRELDCANEAINVLTVERAMNEDHKHRPKQLLLCAAPPDVALHEAGELWEEYRQRRAMRTLQDALEAAEAAPGKAQSSLANAARVFDELEAENRPDTFTLRSPGEILGMTFGDDDNYLGDRMLASGQSLTIVGAGGVGKSRLLLQLAAASIVGRPWISLETHACDKRWLIVQKENNNRRLKDDFSALRSWVTAEDWNRVDRALRIHTVESEADCWIMLDDPAVCSRLMRKIESFAPDVIAFDALYDLSSSDISGDMGMRAVCTQVSRIGKHGDPDRAIVLLHHAITGKAGAAKAVGFDRASFGRNSKVLHSWTRGQINLAPANGDDNGSLVVSCGKCSNGVEFKPFAIRLDPVSMTYDLDSSFDLESWKGEVSGHGHSEGLIMIDPARVRELCEPGMSKVELRKHLQKVEDLSKSGAYKAIGRAEAAKKIHFNKATATYARSSR